MKILKQLALSFAILITILIPAHSYGQKGHRQFDELVNAEKQFAKTSVETNTKNAFLIYLDNEAIVFRTGKPVNGKIIWSKRSADSSLLSWYPEFADIAASGDLGYTTGPWQYKSNRRDTNYAYGHFNSIWKKATDENWKVILDVGVSHGKYSGNESKPVSFSMIHVPQIKNKNVELFKKRLIDREKEFVDGYNRKGNSYYKRYISDEIRIYRPGKLPVVSIDSVNKFLSDKNLLLTFEFISGDIASSGDMGYVYGNVKIHDSI